MSFHGTGTGRIVEAVRERLTYANVMATTAVFIALGGSAWALTANSIGTKHLRDRAVKTDKVADSAITARKPGCRETALGTRWSPRLRRQLGRGF